MLFETCFLPRIPVVKIAKFQVMFRGIILRVSCQATARLDIVADIELAPFQGAVPQVLPVAARVVQIIHVVLRPVSKLVDIGEDVVARSIERMDVIEDVQKAPKSLVLFCVSWQVDARHESEETIESKIIDLGDVGTVVYKSLQECRIVEECDS